MDTNNMDTIGLGAGFYSAQLDDIDEFLNLDAFNAELPQTDNADAQNPIRAEFLCRTGLSLPPCPSFSLDLEGFSIEALQQCTICGLVSCSCYFDEALKDYLPTRTYGSRLPVTFPWQRSAHTHQDIAQSPEPIEDQSKAIAETEQLMGMAKPFTSENATAPQVRPPMRQKTTRPVTRATATKSKKERISDFANLILEKYFVNNPYLKEGDITSIQTETHLSENKIKNWFSNARSRKTCKSHAYSSKCIHF